MAVIVLGIIRKSPTKVAEVKTAVEIQMDKIMGRVYADIAANILPADARVQFVIDICRGDDEQHRTNLLYALSLGGPWVRAYCLNVDRFSRSWLGMKWLHEYFTDGLQLHFVEGIGDLYDKVGLLNDEQYLFFSMQCLYAQYELIKLRKRTAAGRARLSPEEWSQKYKGRKAGTKNKRKPKYLGRQGAASRSPITTSGGGV